METLPDTPEEYRQWWTEQRPDIPYGLCWCGCGEPSPTAPQLESKRQYFPGEPRKYIHGHRARRTPLTHVVEDRGHDTPCWIWQRGRDELGYGTTWRNGGHQRAHVAFYEEAFGPVPTHLELDHRCRVRCCVNPMHLEPVSHAENCQRGATAKLTPQKVREIRHLYASGQCNQYELAARYGVTQTSIYYVVHRKHWRNVF